MWTELRQEIEKARHRLGLPDAAFAPLPYTTNWHQIEETIYHTFCTLHHPTVRPRWLWEYFRPGAYALDSEDDPLATMVALVAADEQVWLMVTEDDKFWFYQGQSAAIHAVLNECAYLDEIYLLSKKYEWLLCLNHHDVVYGIGGPMREQLKSRSARPVVYRKPFNSDALPHSQGNS
jgi:hypothetical protein